MNPPFDDWIQRWTWRSGTGRELPLTVLETTPDTEYVSAARGAGLVSIEDSDAQRVAHPAVRPSTINRSIVMYPETPTTVTPAHATQDGWTASPLAICSVRLEPTTAQGFTL